MHITLISACERRAVKRSRAVLDSYAIRTGERSWATPITLEGLRELRALLKTSATRQTAVACYRNEGRERMRLLWVVGARDAFGPDGHFPAGTMRRKRRPPPWLPVVSLLAQAAGLAHDLGKAGSFFADKLVRAVAAPAAKAEADPVRHEWLSMRVLQLRRRGKDWSGAWSALTRPRPVEEMDGLEDRGVFGPADALDYIVATHHRLFGPRDTPSSTPTCDRHVRDAGQARQLALAGELPVEILSELDRVLARLKRRAGERPPAFWRGAAVLARAALILADHEVSSRPVLPGVKGCGLFANTKNGAFDQPLCWHLQTVSRRAADFAWRIAGLRLPGLATETVEHILSPADERGRFAWQNRAAAVSAFRTRSQAPLLIFNVAATGAGKTIANAKLACVASPRPRFAIALNLRTLTLQTGDALRESLGLGADEMATVIGDRVAARLHAASREQSAYAGTFETDGPATEYDALGGVVLLPGWMKVLTDARPSFAPVIGAPVLVSTIDYLINAGEPGRQAHHVGALLRIADSDLVLDEVDAYAPEALVAVLRLIQTAGLMGRNVICSSATLPVPVAEAVSRAFGSGVAMRGALDGGEGKFGVVVVDDRGPPSVFEGGEDFAQRFRAHLDTLMKLPAKAVRRAFIQPVESRSREGFESAVVTAVRRLHGGHRWRAGTGQTLSFGLVRVANISTAIATARALALALPHARVACYHARDFRIHRHLKEQRLDFLLNRKRGDRHIVADAEIANLLAASSDGDVPFIVVATPVEEIGRDHDFDWGVIEPSSAHSIVQAAGRVNRHRLLPVSEPNIAILRYNVRWALGREGDAIFLRPGLESRLVGMWRYASSDMNLLLQDADLERLDVRLRLGACLMATEEDRIITGRLAEPMKTLLGGQANPSGWMTQGFYDGYRLRDGVPQRTWRAMQESGCWKFQMDEDAVGVGCGRNLALVVERLSNDWLCWDLDELAEACLELEVDTKEGASRGLEFQYPDWGPDAPSWDQSFGFF